MGRDFLKKQKLAQLNYKFPPIRNQEFNYRVHKNLPQDCTIGQIQAVHILTLNRCILILSFIVGLELLNIIFIYFIYFSILMLATCSFDHPNHNKRRAQITKHLITELLPSTSHVLHFTSKYFPQHPVLAFAQRYPSVTYVTFIL
jgi:hypothetical protein